MIGHDLDTNPGPRDRDGVMMPDRCTEAFFHAETLTETAKAVILASDCKEFALIVKTGTLVLRGQCPGTRVLLAASAAVDHTTYVSLTTAVAHGFTVGDEVKIKGPVNYDGTWPVVTGSATTDLRIACALRRRDSSGYCICGRVSRR